jgi:hypothetical protein
MLLPEAEKDMPNPEVISSVPTPTLHMRSAQQSHDPSADQLATYAAVEAGAVGLSWQILEIRVSYHGQGWAASMSG